MPQAEDIIRDLLHPTKEKRIAAIDLLRENWHIDYRPYVWRAIELEKEKSVQRSLVDLAITKLEDNSLRKMIRFVENGQLYPASIKLVVNGYPEYETVEVREALVKAISRETPNIRNFVILLLQHPNLGALGGSKLSFLLQELFSENTPKPLKFEFAKAFLQRYSQKRLPVEYELQSFIRDYKDDVVVRRAIIQFIEEETRQPARKLIRYTWKSFDHTKSSINNLNEYDNYLLDSINYRDDELRLEAIKTIGKCVLSKVPEIYPTQIDALFEIWEMLISFKLERKFCSLPKYDEETLEDFFTGDDEAIYQLIRMSEIPIQVILNFVNGYLPRSILLALIRDDPNSENRKQCFIQLKQESFWKLNDGYLGPLLIWRMIFERIVIASQHEVSREVKEASYQLIEFLISLTMEMDKEYQETIISLIEKHQFVENLSGEKDFTIIASIKLMMNLLLKQENPIFENERIHHDAAINITKKILYHLNNPGYFTIIEKFFDLQGPLTRKSIIEELDIFIHNNKNDIDDYRAAIDQILEKASQDEDVKIRTTAKLIQKKLP